MQNREWITVVRKFYCAENKKYTVTQIQTLNVYPYECDRTMAAK